MKKATAILLILTMIFALCACLSGISSPTEKTARPATEADGQPAAGKGKSSIVKIAVLTMLNLSEEEATDYYETVRIKTDALVKAGKAKYAKVISPEEAKMKEDTKNKVVFYDSLDAMLMALNSGEIDMISTYNSTADYLTANNDQLVKVVNYNYDPAIADDPSVDYENYSIKHGITSNSFAFMMMEKNAALRDEFNTAIASMKEDGTLDRLEKEQIQKVIESGQAKAVQMPVFDDADTVKVAVTGSLPPMDYVAADGSPAGYNTAVLAQISKRTGKNMELVVVDSPGRAAALSSGTVDVVFWTRSNDRSNELSSISEEEYSEQHEKFLSSLTEEQKALINQLNGIFSFERVGQNDIPEGTIITDSYFRDNLVPVMKKK